MRLILIRHGETIENLQGICQGQMDGTLSANGVNQVKLVAKKLQTENIDVIISSDLKRAVDTATGIHNNHPETELLLDKRLRERYFGSFQGKEFPENRKELILPPDAENNEMLFLRVKSFYDHILKNYKWKNIVIVSHGVTLRALIIIINGFDFNKISTMDSLMNGSISIIDLDKNAIPHEITMNSIDHLL